MNATRTVAIVLTPRAENSQVIVDGHDITEMCRGVEITAHVGELTEICVHLIGRVELLADLDAKGLTFHQEPPQRRPEE